jgi:hypothetical protein
MEIVSLSSLTSDSVVLMNIKKMLILSQRRKVLAKFALSSLFTVRTVRAVCKEVTVDSLFSEKENIGKHKRNIL